MAMNRLFAFRFLRLAVILSSFGGICVDSGHAQVWNGIGVSSGGTGTDYGTASNWTNDLVGGDFSSINTTGTYTVGLDAGGDPYVTALNFNFTATGVNFTLGNGTVSPSETINVSGGAVYVSAEASTVVTLGSDLTLNLGSFSTAQTFGFVTNTSGTLPAYTLSQTPILYINALVTGTATSGGSITQAYNTYSAGHSGTVSIVFANNNNTFDAPISVAGSLAFTSIGNIGSASALGDPTTAAHGLITVSNGGSLDYIGTANQSSDREITLHGASENIANESASATDLTLSGVITNYGNSASTLNVFADANDTVTLSGVISDNNGYATSLIKGRYPTLYNGATGAVATGTLILSAANTYSGGTTQQVGTLLVTNTSGSATGTGAVTVAGTGQAAVLGGSGIIAPGGSNGVTVTGSNGIGTIYPGAGGSISTLTFDGGNTSGPLLTMGSGATFKFTLGSSNTSDTIRFFNYAGASDFVLNNNTINFTDAQAGTFVLFEFYSDEGTTLMSSDISSGLTLGTGLTGFTATLDYSDPGEILLDVAAVPEPSTLDLIGLSVLGYIGAAVRKRQRSLVA